MDTQNKNHEQLTSSQHAEHIGDLVLKATLQETYGPDYQERRGLTAVPAEEVPASTEITEIPSAS